MSWTPDATSEALEAVHSFIEDVTVFGKWTNSSPLGRGPISTSTKPSLQASEGAPGGRSR